MNKVVIKKGYTVEVESWENDGDNYRTRTLTVDNKDYALAILNMCKVLFNDDYDVGIGNMIDGENDEAFSKIIAYVSNKPIITEGAKTDTEKVDIVLNINYDLLGSSEFYISRVFESGSIVYSSEDIILEVII